MRGSEMSEQQLVAYAAGELDPQAAEKVEAYLQHAAPRVVERVARLRSAIGVLRTDDTHTPSADAIARHKAILHEHAPAAKESWLDRVRAVIADLVFDSRVQPALAGFRGGGAVQLAYESEVADLEIHLEPVRERDVVRWHVTGQVTTEQSTPSVEIGFSPPGEGRPQFVVTADEHGSFSIPVDPGQYDVLVRLAERVVVMPGLEIG